MLLKWLTLAITLVILISAGAIGLVKDRTQAATELPARTRNWNPQPSEVQLFAPVRYNEIETDFQAAAQPGGATNFSPVSPEPGVYLTAPFACIVIVPPNHLDDAIAVPPPETAFTMPILKPDLRFIPLGEK
jgi:hypothetical protein